MTASEDHVGRLARLLAATRVDGGFGNASGAVTGVNIGILAAKGSLFVTRPTLGTHVVPRRGSKTPPSCLI